MDQHIYHCKFCDQEITRRGVKICRGCGAEIWWAPDVVWKEVAVSAFSVVGLAMFAVGCLYGGPHGWYGKMGLYENYYVIALGAGAILGVIVGIPRACARIRNIRAGRFAPPVFSRPRAGSSWSIGFGFFKF